MLATMDATSAHAQAPVPVRLTIAQVQLRWSCDRRTVLKMVSIGLPCIRLPFGYRFDVSDVEAFEQRHKLTSA
jgi:hypothetical protein